MTVTPAGRTRNLQVLIPYLLRNRGLESEHRFWVNTLNEDDIDAIRRACGAYPDYFRCVPLPFGVPAGPATIQRFYTLKEYCDPEAVFVRIDDDICWMAEDCLYELVKFRIDNPEYFIVYPNIFNNAVCAFLHQRAGVLPHTGEITCDGRCAGNAWSDERFTRLQHEMLIQRIEDDDTDVYREAFDRGLLLDVEQDYHWSEGDPLHIREDHASGLRSDRGGRRFHRRYARLCVPIHGNACPEQHALYEAGRQPRHMHGIERGIPSGSGQ